jgi:hypothetical protein
LTEFKASGASTSFKVSSSGFSTFTVSSGSVTADIKLWGAGGGANRVTEGTTYHGAGAAGGLTEARVTLPVGNYAILVGQGGLGGNQGANNSARRFPDGGRSTEASRSDGGASGGGSTRLGLVTQGGITLADSSAHDGTSSFNKTAYGNYIAIAGGGAGSCGYQTDDASASTADPDFGRGGGISGGNGSMAYITSGSSESVNSCGHGGTQTAGAEAGDYGRLNYNPTDGAKYSGGDGAAGGGGGFYGGGGSQGYYAQAGGGSGFIDSNYCVAGQTNHTIVNGGNSATTFYNNITSDATYATAGEGGFSTTSEDGRNGLFTLTVIS